ncbi:MAG TPA: hypothetical protein VGB17_19120 [Pyrinomonadaceae bacterium]|jgi:hypothetical protein
MKKFRNYLLAAAVFAVVGLAVSLFNAGRYSTPLGREVVDEHARAEAKAADGNGADDKSSAKVIGPEKKIVREKSVSHRIKQWGLDSWSRVRRRVRRAV